MLEVFAYEHLALRETVAQQHLSIARSRCIIQALLEIVVSRVKAFQSDFLWELSGIFAEGKGGAL